MRRYYVADIGTNASKRTDDHDLNAFEKSEDHGTRFALAVGPTNERRPREDKSRILKVDMAFAQYPLALGRIPFKIANLREQLRDVFRHSDPPPDGGCDTFSIAEGLL
jgi:hypothetical protein